MELDELEPTKKPSPPKNLEVMSIAELAGYIAELEAEIARARAEIAAKQAQRGAAEALFRK
jgi:uncharacterized small protein (DUF1192 family)